MTFKELQRIMDKARTEVEKMHATDEDNFYRNKLYEIRNKAFELNKETCFYGICDIDFDTFEKCMGEYTYSDQMVIAYHLLQHIRLLDNMIFDEEGEDGTCN